MIHKHKLNCGFLFNTPPALTTLLQALLDQGKSYEAQVSEMDGRWDVISPDEFLAFQFEPCDEEGCGILYDDRCDDLTSGPRTSEDLCNWILEQIATHEKITNLFASLNSSRRHLNADLSGEQASRIKSVFKIAQESVMFPNGFRYTAFRQNRSEDTIISTLMYTSSKMGATQWVVKSALGCDFGDEDTPDTWSFQPDYDPESAGSHERSTNAKVLDRTKVSVFTPKVGKVDPDTQVSYWLVGILQRMVDDIIENPPNRVYEFFLADGILKKKNLALMADMGLIRLASKGVITGIEILKVKPNLWKKLLEKGFITGEQALKAWPNQLLWLTVHDYIPVERALKIDPSIEKKLEKAGKLTEDTSGFDSTDVDTIVSAVADGTITPQKAWSLNPKVVKPLIEAQLLSPQDAYKLEPSVLNWMLENHYIGRAEAQRLKPGIKREMDKKGVAWEELDASIADEADDDFYVSVEYGSLIIKLTKQSGRWYEEEVYLDPEFEDEVGRFQPGTYMGYLSRGEILSWIRRDYPGCQVNQISEDEVEDFMSGYDEDEWELPEGCSWEDVVSADDI